MCQSLYTEYFHKSKEKTIGFFRTSFPSAFATGTLLTRAPFQKCRLEKVENNVELCQKIEKSKQSRAEQIPNGFDSSGFLFLIICQTELFHDFGFLLHLDFLKVGNDVGSVFLCSVHCRIVCDCIQFL